MQPFFVVVGYSLWGGGGGGGRFRVQALNLTIPLGSIQTISGTGRVRASVLSPCRPLLEARGHPRAENPHNMHTQAKELTPLQKSYYYGQKHPAIAVAE